MTDFDVIIIGGGAAGLSAALWCDELGLSTLLVEKNGECGGQLLRVYNRIENHLGICAADGREMRDVFLHQTEKRNFRTRLNAEVSGFDPFDKIIFLSGGESLTARSIVIATGVRRRRLNVAGESEFAGQGIIESGKKEQSAVSGKRVLIVGGGDAALENSLILAETAARVFLVHRRREFSARSEFVEQARRNPKIEILTESVVRKINGTDRLASADLENLPTGELRTVEIENLLIRVGIEPNTEILRGKLDLDADGYVKVNQSGETSVENVFAAGDVANRVAPTVSTAVGTGAAAAKAILDKLSA